MGARKPRVTKEQAEQAIFDRFAKAYERHYGASLEGRVHRDKPDFSARDSVTTQTLGIEVTGAYHDAREAEINYWLNGDWGVLTGSLDNFVDSINQVFADKSQTANAYDRVGPLLLAIWIGSFVFNQKRDMNFLAPRLTIPKNPYSLIALVVTDDTGTLPTLHILQELTGWRESGAA